MGVAVPLRLRSGLSLALVSAVGLVAFGWPLLAGSGSTLAHTAQTPWLFALLLPLLLAVVLAEVSEGGLDARAIAMLGLLAAVGAALRPLGAGTAGIEPVFALLIPAGRVFGRGFGFVLGAVTLLASALLTAGVGPWLPFQMLGAAWIGFGAGCLPRMRGRAEIALLAGYALLAGLAYGLALDLSIWPYGATGIPSLAYLPGAPVHENVLHLLRFMVATSLGWDLIRGLTLAALTLVAGRPVLLALRRAARRARFVPASGDRADDPGAGRRAGDREHPPGDPSRGERDREGGCGPGVGDQEGTRRARPADDRPERAEAGAGVQAHP
jgi:energy-coupling factor transport system substrate-specific component